MDKVDISTKIVMKARAIQKVFKHRLRCNGLIKPWPISVIKHVYENYTIEFKYKEHVAVHVYSRRHDPIWYVNILGDEDELKLDLRHKWTFDEVELNADPNIEAKLQKATLLIVEQVHWNAFNPPEDWRTPIIV